MGSTERTAIVVTDILFVIVAVTLSRGMKNYKRFVERFFHQLTFQKLRHMSNDFKKIQVKAF